MVGSMETTWRTAVNEMSGVREEVNERIECFLYCMHASSSYQLYSYMYFIIKWW